MTIKMFLEGGNNEFLKIYLKSAMGFFCFVSPTTTKIKDSRNKQKIELCRFHMYIQINTQIDAK